MKFSIQSIPLRIRRWHFKDTVTMSFLGIFILIGIITMILFSFSAQFLSEQVQIMTESETNFENAATMISLDTESLLSSAESLGLSVPNL